MKILRYAVMGWQITMNPETMQERREEMPAIIETAWSAEAEAYARQVALGDVEIYDDGEEAKPSTDDVVNALLGVE